MAVCPYLSYKQDNIDPDTGDVTYLTDSGSDGTFDGDGFFQCFQSDTCQMWDSKNDRCGMVSSDYIKDTTDSTSRAVVNLIEGIIGDYDEKDSGNSLLMYLQRVLGEVTERDQDHSLLVYLQNLFGKISELDSTSSLVVYFQNIIGAISEIDTDPTHQIGSILKTKTHTHNDHDHASDPNHEHPASAPPSAAMILISEFMSNEDQDGGKGPGSSIYGKDFMIIEDADCPPALKAIHGHSDWSDPATSITWATYLSY